MGAVYLVHGVLLECQHRPSDSRIISSELVYRTPSLKDLSHSLAPEVHNSSAVRWALGIYTMPVGWIMEL